MMKKITYLFMLLAVSVGYAQQIVIENFNGTAPTFAGFGGVTASIEADPAAGGTRGNGFKLVMGAGEVYQGGEMFTQSNNIKLTTDKTVLVDVFCAQAFTLLAKVENGSGPNSAASKAYTTPGVWQTLTFTFNESLDGTGVANGEYGKIVFFPNWKADNTGFNNPIVPVTIHVDNITAEGAPILAAVTSLNIDFQTATSVGGTDLTYTDLFTNDLTTGINTSTLCGQVQNINIADYAFMFYNVPQGLDFSTGNKGFSLMVKGPRAIPILFKVEGAGNTEVPGNYTTPGVWQKVTWDFSADTSANKNKIVVFFDITGAPSTPASNDVFLVDNLRFDTLAALSTKGFKIAGLNVYPNPSKNSWNIKTSNINMSAITVYDILGKNVLSLTPNATDAAINGSSLKAGLYFAQIKTANGVSSIKLVKE